MLNCLRANELGCLLAIALLFTAASPGARAATVGGFVHSSTDGETLDHANVFLENTPYGDMANEKGYYVITGIPAGEYRIAFHFIGYATEVRTITLGGDEDLTMSVELEPEAIKLPKVEVVAGPSDLVLEPGKMTLRTREVGRVPAVVEADLFRAVQSLPGVSTLSDFSSGLYVRGGSADENLILLDDIDVYNPSHLFGFFSTFNVDAVKSVDLQKSGYPARYGGRLSSLLDVHNRDGNRKEFQGVGRVSVLGATATLEGPWKKGSWMVAGRHTYLEAIAKAADLDIPYNFYDLHAKLNYDINPSNKTSFSAFRGRDRLDWEVENLDVLLDWGNDTWSAQWTHLFNSRLFSHFVIGSSHFTSKAEIAFEDFAFRINNKIDDIAAKGNLSYTPAGNHLIDFGFEMKSLDFSFFNARGEEDELEFAYDGVYAAAYGQDSWNLSREWQIQTGLRLDYYSEGDYLDLGPRLTVRRKWNEIFSTHLTFGRYFQYLNLVSEEGASFADMWFPVDETLQPGSSDHMILGFDLGPTEHFDLSIEGYYKRYANVVEFSEEFGASLIDEDAELGEAFDTGKGKAYGIDLYLRNNISGWEGWLGYAWGVTRRRINDFNYGLEYSPVYDRKHQIVAMQERSLGKGWRLNLNFRYGTGQPTTLGAGRYTVQDVTGREYDAILPGGYNVSRLPDYHRLDLGITYSKQFKGWSLEPTLQIINVYNRENVYQRFYDTSENPLKFEDVTMLPLIPTIGVRVSF